MSPLSAVSFSLLSGLSLLPLLPESQGNFTFLDVLLKQGKILSMKNGRFLLFSLLILKGNFLY